MTRRSTVFALALALSVPVAGLTLWTPVAPAQTSSPAAPAASVESQIQQKLKQFDDLYHLHRHEPGVVNQCRTVLEEARKLQGGDRYEILWRQAQLQWWLADGESNSDKVAALAQKGWEYGEKAVKLNPNGVEGNLWLAANIGQYSLGVGVLRALANGLEGKFNEPLDKSIKLNQRYECASPLRTKGSYYQNLPWPKRDLKKGIELLKKSLQLEPCGVRSRYYLAEAYEKDGNIPAAMAEMDAILSAKPNNIDPGDLPRLQQFAKKMKARLQAEN